MSNIVTPVYHVAMDPETYISVVSLMKRKEEARLKAREKYRLEQAKLLEPKAPKAPKVKNSKFVVTKISYDEPVAEVSAAMENLKLENTV